MRVLILFIVAITVCSLAPSSGATGSAAPLLEDPAGDVSLAGTTSAASPSEKWGHVDLRQLDLTETLDLITFTLTVEALEPAAALFPIADAGRYTVSFEFEHATYRIDATYGFHPTAASSLVASAWRGDANGDWTRIGDIQASAAIGENQITLQVPRGWLIGSGGESLEAGGVLANIQASATSNSQPSAATAVYDFVPDEGPGPSWTTQMGLQQQGHLRFLKGSYQASNGGALVTTTKLVLTSSSDDADRVHVDVESLPQGWTVQIPEADLVLPAHGQVEVSVILASTAAHQHGSTAAAVIYAVGEVDASAIARAHVGIHYPTPPQPAGHHATLYIHSRDGVTPQGFTNTAPKDLTNDGVPITPTNHDDWNGTDAIQWHLPLQPAWELPLVLNHDNKGHVEVTFNITHPMQTMKLAGEIGVARGEDWIPLFQFLQHAASEALVPTSIQLEAELTAVHGAPITVAPEPGDVLQARVVLLVGGLHTTSERIGEPELLPGGEIRLPLDEYEGVLAPPAKTGLAVRIDDPLRYANPGGAIVASIRIESPLDSPIDVQIQGTHSHWARWISGNDERMGAVIVRIPDDAQPDEQALILVVATQDNERAAAALRLLITATPLEDDSALAETLEMDSQRDTPAVTWIATLVAIVAALRRTNQTP